MTASCGAASSMRRWNWWLILRGHATPDGDDRARWHEGNRRGDQINPALGLGQAQAVERAPSGAFNRGHNVADAPWTEPAGNHLDDGGNDRSEAQSGWLFLPRNRL